MPKYAFVTLNPSRNYQWELHAADCRDLYNPQSRNGGTKSGVDFIEAPNIRVALRIGLDPETRELGWDDDAVDVLACTRRATDRRLFDRHPDHAESAVLRAHPGWMRELIGASNRRE